MGMVYSGTTSTGTYTSTRVRVEYNNTSATAILLYTRTNTYSGQTGGSGTFTFGGQSVSYNKYFTGQQTDAEVARVSFTISLAGGTYSGTSVSNQGFLNFNGSVVIPSQQQVHPLGLKMTNLVAGTNEFSATVSITSWGGTPTTGTNAAYKGLYVYTKGQVEPRYAMEHFSTALSSNINKSLYKNGTLSIQPNTAYDIGIYASYNGLSTGGTGMQWQGLNYTLPPAFTSTLVSTTHKTAVLRYSIPNQGGALALNLQYSVDGDNWLTMADVVGSGAKTGEWTITGLQPSTTYSIRTRIQTNAGSNTGSTVSLTTQPFPSRLYGSVNGNTKKTKKIYGSVNGQTKEITKVYGSVNGQTKRIF